MFNDPFEPLQEIVGQAKEEREQLDRLLTVATPRERLLVAACALGLLALAAWLLLGGAPRSVAFDGVLVGAAAPAAAGRTVEAAAWLDWETARQLAAGMAIAAELENGGGKDLRVVGEIASLAAVPGPGDTVPRDPRAPGAMHRVGILLSEEFGGAEVEDADCRIVVTLGEYSPAALIGLRSI